MGRTGNFGLCETELVASVSAPGNLDVIIIGAGVAGLAALSELDKAGANVLCLEARERIGGRILTVHDPASPIPIELGAEFVHGRPPETWDIIDAAGFAAYDCTEHALHIEAGRIVDRADAWLPIDEIMSEMERAAERGPDQSFASFLAATNYPREAKKLATSYVEGFNAAYDDRIGIASLALDSQASNAIDGDRSFRLLNGYDAIPAFLLRQTKNARTAVRLNSVVEHVRWHRNLVSVSVRSPLTGQRHTFEGSRLIITVPLGVLQAETGEIGAIEFDPVPVEALSAARKLCFGQVFRTVLRFADRFLDQDEKLAEVGFLLSDEPAFPTWWTTLPIHTPLITGWSAGRKAGLLVGQTREFIIGKAIDHLARITSVEVAELQSQLAAAHFHDWSNDPFSRGAYSYVPPGGLRARELLAQPIDDTLYFSGEATDTNGHGATVHGAIASGMRAARAVLETLD
jgi:monoamine oxidase